MTIWSRPHNSTVHLALCAIRVDAPRITTYCNGSWVRHPEDERTEQPGTKCGGCWREVQGEALRRRGLLASITSCAATLPLDHLQALDGFLVRLLLMPDEGMAGHSPADQAVLRELEAVSERAERELEEHLEAHPPDLDSFVDMGPEVEPPEFEPDGSGPEEVEIVGGVAESIEEAFAAITGGAG